MAWDPTTGMWEPDVTRQPLGALGSAMQFFNARKARDISGQLEADRLLGTESKQFTLDEARKARARDEELRAALGDMPEDARTEDYINTYARFGDPSKLPSLYRTMESGNIRTNIQGMKGDQAIEQIGAKEELPSTQANIGKTKAETYKLEEQTMDIALTRPEREALMTATAEAKKQYAAMAAKRAGGGKFGPKEKAIILDKIAKREIEIQAMTTEKDILGQKRTRKNLSKEEQAAVDELRSIQTKQKALLDEDAATPTEPAAEDESDPYGVFK